MKLFYFALAATVLISSTANAGFTLSVDTSVQLAPNLANQSVDLLLTSNSAGDPALKGMNIGIYLGNDANAVLDASQGVFSSVDFTGGGFFWDTGLGGDGNATFGLPSVAEGGVNFNSNASHFVGDGNTVKVATLKIDTTGLFSGTFAISLNDPFGIGVQPFELIDAANNVIAEGAEFSIVSGSFSIESTPVPEPASLAMVGLAGALAVGMRRRHRKTASETLHSAA